MSTLLNGYGRAQASQLRSEMPDADYFDLELDARGLNCPLPLLRAQRVLKAMNTGMLLRVLVTDPHAVKDFSLYCGLTGHTLIKAKQADDCQVILIRRKP